MNLKLTDETQLLDAAFRKVVIAEIIGSENIARKQNQLKRTEVYRDKTSKYVEERLRKQELKEKTITQMMNRATNVSVCKKIVNKLARVYVGGVERINEQGQEQIDAMGRLLEINQKMKKADRYRELHKNALVMALPEAEWMSPLYSLKLKVFAPWQYDVIEDYRDNEIARALVLTDFVERNQFSRQGDPEGSADGRDQVIADNEEDKSQCYRKFIWWSGLYHFTTDESGEILTDESPEGGLNPIGMIPGIFISEDQDGQFWARGGDDLIDGSILLNMMLTDMNSIMYQQGYGQLVVKGKDIKKEFDVGPHTAIYLEQMNGDDPTPAADFISANPPVADWMQAAEQIVALMLSTNNLSPGSISGKLDASQFASGIAMLIEQSEALGELDDIKTLFTCKERDLWEVLRRWQDVYLKSNLLTDEFKEIGPLPDVSDLVLRFIDLRPAISEKEKVDILQARKDLGLNTDIELLKLDNPELSDEQAKEKLLQLKLEKAERLMQVQQQMGQQSPQGVSNGQENGSQAQSQTKEEVAPPSEGMDANL